MRVPHPDLAAPLLGLAAMLALGCGDSSGPTPEKVAETGTIRVSTSTLGLSPDPDGYSIVVTGVPGPAVGATGTIEIAGLPAGEHTVELGGVAANCRIEGSNPRKVNLAPGGTAEIVFTVRCSNMTSVKVTTITTGIDRDTNGYFLNLHGTGFLSVRLPSNGTVSLSPNPGNYPLSLSDMAANCDVISPSPRQIAVVIGSPLEITLDIRCEEPKQLAFVRGEGAAAEIYVMRSNRTDETRNTFNSVPDIDPAWSPDGRKIVFASLRDENYEIYVMDSNGGNQTRLTTLAAPDYRPAWSPDGRRIAFVSERDGNAEIYVMDADGTNPRRLTSEAGADSDPAWSPDGSRIAFRSERGGSNGIWVMNADGSGAARITTNPVAGGDADPAWSPDGARIAFVSSLNVRFGRGLAIVNADGSARILLFEGSAVSKPAWSPNGRKIAAADDDFYYGREIFVVSTDGIRTYTYLGAGGSHPAWRP